MKKTLFCLAKNVRQAEHIIEHWVNIGCRGDQISLAFREEKNEASHQPEHESEHRALAWRSIENRVEINLPVLGRLWVAGPLAKALEQIAKGSPQAILQFLHEQGLTEREALRFAERLKDTHQVLLSVVVEEGILDRIREIAEFEGVSEITTTHELVHGKI